jgi:hypothetical protein
LDGDGLRPQLVVGVDVRPHGYTVALPGDHTADGQPVRYSGSALATDLTWPKPIERWASTPPPATPPPDPGFDRTSLGARQGVLHTTADLVRRTRAAIGDGGQDVDGAVHATGELLTALARAHDGRATGALTAIAQQYDRAARTPHRVLPSPLGLLAADLRRAARQLGTIGTLSGRGQERFATAALVLALSSLIAEIAAWQHERRRPHQAVAARSAAITLSSTAAASARPDAPAPNAQPIARPDLRRSGPNRPRPTSQPQGRPRRGR